MDYKTILKSLEKDLDFAYYENIFSKYSEQYFKLFSSEFPLVETLSFEKAGKNYPYLEFIIEHICLSINSVPASKNMLPDYINEVKGIVKQLKRNFRNGVYEKYCAPLLYKDYCVKFDEWCQRNKENDYCDFTNFPFFDFLRGHTQVEYLFKELHIRVLRLFLDADSIISFLPEAIVSQPFFSIGSADPVLVPCIIEGGTRVALNYENTSSDGTRVRITVEEVAVPSFNEKTPEEQERELAKIIEDVSKQKKLTSFDAVVLQVIYQHLNVMNINNTVIHFLWGEFAEECFKVDRQLHNSDYDKLKESLDKLSKYAINYETEDAEEFAEGRKHLYLTDYNIIRDKTKGVGDRDYNYSARLDITISEKFRNDWLNSKNYEILTPIYELVSDSTQRLLLFPLQRERLKAIVSGINKSILDLAFFYDMVDYGGEKKYFKRLLNKHLDELRERGVLIKDITFYRTKHVIIEWLELSDLEKEIYEVSAN